MHKLLTQISIHRNEEHCPSRASEGDLWQVECQLHHVRVRAHQGGQAAVEVGRGKGVH